MNKSLANSSRSKKIEKLFQTNSGLGYIRNCAVMNVRKTEIVLFEVDNSNEGNSGVFHY